MGSTAPPDPFEALANAQRRSIVEILAARPSSVQEIADALPISRPAVSRHLRVLSGAGLVVSEPDGARRLYHLEGAGVEAVRQYLTRVWGDAEDRFRMFAENTREGSKKRTRS